MKRKYSFMFRAIVTSALLMAFWVFSVANNNSDTTNQCYVVIGTLEECKDIEWLDKTAPKYTSVSLSDGTKTLSIEHHMPVLYYGFILNECDIFMVSNGLATNVYTNKKVLLMNNKLVLRDWEKICESRVKTKDIKVYYGIPHQFPERLIKDHNLEEFFIIKATTANPDDLKIPKELLYTIKQIEMKEHGIILPDKYKLSNQADAHNAEPDM